MGIGYGLDKVKVGLGRIGLPTQTCIFESATGI